MNWAHTHLLVNHVPVLGPLFAAGFLLLALVTRDRDGWVRAAIVTLAASFAGAVAAYLSGSPAITDVASIPRTSGKALAEHHGLALIATVLVGMAAAAAIVALVVRRRRAAHATWMVAVVLACTLVAAGAMGLVGLAGGRINHPELQTDADRAGGPASTHHH